MKNELFNYYTVSRYDENKKVFSFQYVASPATIFEYSSHYIEERVPAIAESAIGRLVVEVFSFSEYHASTPYEFRKKIPSARSIHPFLPVIHYRGFLFLYDANSNDFSCFGYDTTKQNVIELFICVDLWRTCAIYGEFGIALSLLELGHLHADIKWLINDDDCLALESGEFCFAPYSSLTTSERITNANDLYVMSSIKIIELEDCLEGLMKPIPVMSIKKKYNYTAELQALGVQLFLKQAEETQLRFAKSYHTNIKNLHVKRKQRHSLNKRQATFHLGPPLKRCIFKAFLSQLNENTKDWLLPNVSFYFFIHQVEGISRGVYKYEGDDIYLVNPNFEMHSIFYESQEFMNLDTLPFLVLMTFTDFEDQSLSSFIEAHIHIGEIVHTMSLLYASEDTFTRPFKNINDAYCQKLCQTEQNEYFIYGCLFGSGRKRIGLKWR